MFKVLIATKILVEITHTHRVMLNELPISAEMRDHTESIWEALMAPTEDGDVVYSGAVNPRLKWLRMGINRSSSSRRGSALAVC